MRGLQKLEQRTKKCIELRGEYVEEIPSVVAVACFLPGRAEDLSAPPRTISNAIVIVTYETSYKKNLTFIPLYNSILIKLVEVIISSDNRPT